MLKVKPVSELTEPNIWLTPYAKNQGYITFRVNEMVQHLSVTLYCKASQRNCHSPIFFVVLKTKTPSEDGVGIADSCESAILIY